MAPTAVAVVERAVLAWNRGELDGPPAGQFAALGQRPLELLDFRSLGDKVIAQAGERTLLFTVKRSRITELAVFEPGERVPALVEPTED
jgi:hypothetical protein